MPEPRLTEIREIRKARRRRLTERLQTLRERVRLLEIELRDYTNDFFRVCIFGSARIKPEDRVYKITHELGIALGREGIDVLTGGGPGLMEAANKGVREGTRLSGSNSRSFGITIELGAIEPASEHLDIKHHHQKFSSRLDDFMRLSNAVVIVPGGIGTLLELFFSWQLVQVAHLSQRPIILLDSKFWEGLVAWMKDQQLGMKLVSPGDFNWLHLVDTPEQAMEVIKKEKEKFTSALKDKLA